MTYIHGAMMRVFARAEAAEDAMAATLTPERGFAFCDDLCRSSYAGDVRAGLADNCVGDGVDSGACDYCGCEV